MKPSGLKWVGEAPEHWDLKPAKYFFHEVDERSKRDESYFHSLLA